VSKFALVGLSDALRAELSSKNISVTTVVPGLLRTGSHKNAFFKGQHRKEFAWFSLGAGNPLVSMDADRAAYQILDAVRNRRPELTITFTARLAAIAQALLPISRALSERRSFCSCMQMRIGAGYAVERIVPRPMTFGGGTPHYRIQNRG